nr:hypothetical protein [Afifella sp. H1R]
MVLSEIAARLGRHGLILRGGFHPDKDEVGLDGCGTLLLVGNAGPAMWRAFAPHAGEGPDPLDRWTEHVVEPVAEAFGGKAVYPFDRPHRPFQRWAGRAEGLGPSPLGILIHPEYGLWHAYRAALLFAERFDLPPRPAPDMPCESCTEKPCLKTCPASAVSEAAYDVAACAAHIVRREADCLAVGCHARNACPVGAAYRYQPAETAFHMRAFARFLPRAATA